MNKDDLSMYIDKEDVEKVVRILTEAGITWRLFRPQPDWGPDAYEIEYRSAEDAEKAEKLLESI